MVRSGCGLPTVYYVACISSVLPSCRSVVVPVLPVGRGIAERTLPSSGAETKGPAIAAAPAVASGPLSLGHFPKAAPARQALVRREEIEAQAEPLSMPAPAVGLDDEVWLDHDGPNGSTSCLHWRKHLVLQQLAAGAAGAARAPLAEIRMTWLILGLPYDNIVRNPANTLAFTTMIVRIFNYAAGRDLFDFKQGFDFSPSGLEDSTVKYLCSLPPADAPMLFAGLNASGFESLASNTLLMTPEVRKASLGKITVVRESLSSAMVASDGDASSAGSGSSASSGGSAPVARASEAAPVAVRATRGDGMADAAAGQQVNATAEEGEQDDEGWLVCLVFFCATGFVLEAIYKANVQAHPGDGHSQQLLAASAAGHAGAAARPAAASQATPPLASPAVLAESHPAAAPALLLAKAVPAHAVVPAAEAAAREKFAAEAAERAKASAG